VADDRLEFVRDEARDTLAHPKAKRLAVPPPLGRTASETGTFTAWTPGV
jgi:hypothetical protein